MREDLSTLELLAVNLSRREARAPGDDIQQRMVCRERQLQPVQTLPRENAALRRAYCGAKFSAIESVDLRAAPAFGGLSGSELETLR